MRSLTSNADCRVWVAESSQSLRTSAPTSEGNLSPRPSPLAAQTLDTQVVIASRIAEPLAEVLPAVSVITRNEIQQQNFDISIKLLFFLENVILLISVMQLQITFNYQENGLILVKE